MSWIRVDVSLPTHHKSLELAQILGLDRAHSLMVDLWCWAQVNAPDGRIGGRNPVRMVETAVGWQGEAGAFVDAALEARFLDRDGDVLVLHNWEEHNGKALKRAEESAGRMRAYRERKETERTRQRDAPLTEADARTRTECEPNASGTHALPLAKYEPNANGTHAAAQTDCELKANGAHAVTQTEREPNAERNDTRRNKKLEASALRVAEPPAPPKTERKLSAQESFWAWFQTERAKRFPEALPDRSLDPRVLNSQLKEPLRLAGELALRQGALAYFGSPFARDECAPQGAFAPFVANYSRHVPRVGRPGPPRDSGGRNGANFDDQDPAAFEPPPLELAGCDPPKPERAAGEAFGALQ